MSNFQPLEIVGRGSEPQIQVGEKLITWLFKLFSYWLSYFTVKLNFLYHETTIFNLAYFMQLCFIHCECFSWPSLAYMCTKVA